MIIRAAKQRDNAAICDVLRAAFAGEQEADLVGDIRWDGELLLSMVAEDAGHVIGYIGFSRLWIAGGEKREPGASLAPLAVVAGHRRRGVGAALVGAGHARLRSAGESIVFVLGNPAYYARFGYTAQAAAAFDSVYAGPHFQALALSSHAPRAGTVTYAAAFGRLQ